MAFHSNGNNYLLQKRGFILIFAFELAAHLFPTVSVGYPIRKTTDCLAYLQKFGYIDDSLADSAAAADDVNEIQLRIGRRHRLHLTDGIKQFQYFAGIVSSGILDNTTMELMNLPRCGNKERLPVSESAPAEEPSTRRRLRRRRRRRRLQKRYIIDSKWEKIYLTYKINNYPKLTSTSMTRDRVDSQVELAFQLWAQETNLHIVKSSAAPAETMADIEISFVTGDHNDGIIFEDDLDGPGKVVAHAWKPFNTHPLRGDIHFNDDLRWTSGPPPPPEAEVAEEVIGYDFFRTLVHEIGHSLGLEHSPHGNSIMYFAIHGYEKNLNLSADDKDGIQQLYGKKHGTGTVNAFLVNNSPMPVPEQQQQPLLLQSSSVVPSKPLVIPSGPPDKKNPWACYILQEEEPQNYLAIKQCYQQFYRQYYLTLLTNRK